MLSTFDLILIIVYLLLMVVIGIAARGRQQDAGDYFTGGFSKLLGSILVGLSIAATFFSGISFLAYPSLVYGQGTGIMVGLITFPIAWLIVGWWFLPRYLRGGARQPYQVIEDHFGYPTRATAAGLFVLLRIGWMGTLIYAPTVAIIGATQLEETAFWPIVLTLGLCGTFYTALGGIRGVMVTDAIQMVVMTLGVLFPVIYVLRHIPITFDAAWAHLGGTGHLDWFNPSLSFTQPLTVWSVLLGAGVANIGIYLADQMSLQRYLASENLRAARRAFAINVFGVMVVIVLLAVVGLSMAVWYGTVQGAVPPEKADQVFPFFVVSQLPVGVPGLIIAAILAATMSSMTSGINALAGTLTLDFAARSGRLADPRQQLWFGRYASVMIGLAATGVAGLVQRLGTIFDIAQIVIGVFLGPLLACILHAVLRSPVSGVTMICGMLAGCVTGWIVHSLGAYSLWVAPSAAAVAFTLPLIATAARSLRPLPSRKPQSPAVSPPRAGD